MDGVAEEVIKILQNKIQCHCEGMEKNMDLPLTGAPFYLSEIDMVYLLFEIEKKYRIQIEEQYLIDYKFSTMNQIVEIIKVYL